MCGIIGRINFDGSAVDGACLVAAADSLEHRGPDDSGYWNEHGCGFAHRRFKNFVYPGTVPALLAVFPVTRL